MQQVWLFIHIVGVATWFGTNVAVAIMSNRYSKIDGAPASEFHESLAALGTRSQTPAAVAVLISGVILVLGNDAYSFGSAFVSLGIFTVVFGAIVGARFFGPKAREISALHAAGDTGTARKVEMTVVKVGTADILLLTITIAAMVWRWGA